MGFWNKLLSYFNLFRAQKSPREGEKANFSLKAMHTMNRIAILMLFAGLCILIYKVAT